MKTVPLDPSMIHPRIDHLLQQYLQNQPCPARALQSTMHYAVFNGGKRLRPLLIYATGHLTDAPLENLDIPAAAIELIHAYSLVHDDLPAMDNADLRRGKPSAHRYAGEAMAILTGDALQTLAFEIIATHPTQTLSAAQRIQMIQILTKASGYQGMAAGQALDCHQKPTHDTVHTFYALKTGALITASVELGLCASTQKHPQHQTLIDFATQLGLAFQLQDDLLDLLQSSEITGKPSGLDQANQKVTYPTLFGIEETQTKMNALFNQALASLNACGNEADPLRDLAHRFWKRNQ